VLALPCVLAAMDLTVLILAVPALSADLKPTSAQLLWIVDIYGFTLAGSLMTMGTLGDRIGRRRLLLIGAGAFGASSVLAAFSTSAGMLIATRALLGLAGATLAPSTLSLIRNMFLDSHERGVAIGVWISSYAIGTAVGPVVGGALLEHFWWGSVFLLGVPVMALLLALGPILLPEFTDPEAGRIDILSAALSLIGVLLVIYGLKHIAQSGLQWHATISIVAGFGVGLVFVRRQRRLTDPMIDLRLFQAPAFSMSLATYALASFVSLGMFVFVSQYLQLVLGLSPLHAGLWTMPFDAAFIVGSLLTPAIARRIRPTSVIAGGLALAAVGFGVLTQAGGPAGVIIPVSGLVLYALGLVPVFTLATGLIVGSAPPNRAGAVSALSETGSELGAALGVAILGSLGTAVYRGVMATALPHGVPAEAAVAARDTLEGAVVVAGHLAGPLGAELLGAARGAFTHAMQWAAFVSAALALATAITSTILLRNIAADTQAREDIEPREGLSATPAPECLAPGQ
jgi:DHA2 family multidrug resistance protein-like MFS transporter